MISINTIKYIGSISISNAFRIPNHLNLAISSNPFLPLPQVHDRARAGHYYDLEDLYPLQKCKYMGLEVYCPRKPRKVFGWLYGDDMRSKKVCVKGKWKRSKISDLTDRYDY